MTMGQPSRPINLKAFQSPWVTALVSLLLLRFLLLAIDPRLFLTASQSQHNQATLFKGVFQNASGLVELIYSLSDLLLLALNLVTEGLILLFPILENPWFPVMKASHLEALIDAYGGLALGEPHQIDILVGVMDGMSLVGIVVLLILAPYASGVKDFLKNWGWNILTEITFTQEKQALYQEALLKRSRDLMKLNVEYKNLSREANILKDSVNTDPLTKVYNKRFFTQQMSETFLHAKQNQTPLALVMVDIDYFKKLNDEYGHLFGDFVLKEVAQVIRRSTGAEGIVCRFGGEEFAIIFPGIPLEQVLLVTEAIRDELSFLSFEEKPGLKVSVSQGVVYLDFAHVFAKALDSQEDFIKFADDELYRAKLEGRARTCTNVLG